MNKLPREILSQIIQRVPCMPWNTDTQPIIPLTHVCQHWRAFIIATPQIWTSISNRSRGLAALSLQRAKAVPLEFWLDMSRLKKRREFSGLINSHIQNAKTLRFFGFRAIEELSQTLPNLPRPMPNLQSLTLDRSGNTEQKDSVDPFESLAPTLRYLKLVDVPLYPSFLRLRALTELALRYRQLRLNVNSDTLLGFLEDNHSLKSATLDIENLDPCSQRGTAIMNRLQHLSITCHNRRDKNAHRSDTFLSNIALRKGAHLELLSCTLASLNEVLSDIPAVQLPNLLSPTFLQYEFSSCRRIRLLGPNGRFSSQEPYSGNARPFVEFPLLPLTNIRDFHLKQVHGSGWEPFDPSFLPALETLVVNCQIGALSLLLSALFLNPSFPPSLKTLAFLNCSPSGDFMEALTKFASNRKNTTSAWLHRVVIVDSKENLPTTASINALGKHVPDVDIRVGERLPTDLA